MQPDQFLAGAGGKPIKKRAAQNREAQRAFRLRKALYIQDLEGKAQTLASIEQQVANLSKENKKLKKGFDILKAQVSHYKVRADEILATKEIKSGNRKRSRSSNVSEDAPFALLMTTISSLSDVSSDDEESGNFAELSMNTLAQQVYFSE